MIIEEKNKKIIIPAIVLIFIIAGFLIYKSFYINFQKEKVPKPQEYDDEKAKIESQYQELTKLRKEAGDQPLTPEEINLQMQELDYLRKLAK